MQFFKRKFSAYISEAQGDDLPYVSSIHGAGFSRGWNTNELSQMLSSDNTFCLVCRSEGQLDLPPMGFVICRQILDEAEILSISTEKKQRRKGVARILMEETIRRLQTDRRKSLFLEVDEANEPAISLYKQLGFVLAGKREGYYEPDNTLGASSKTAALVMHKEL